jgi:hypothetical protein
MIEAPAAIGPYSQAIKLGDLLFTAGCIPLNPETGKVVEGGIEEQVISYAYSSSSFNLHHPVTGHASIQKPQERC